jgi:hypothetical protein
MRFQVSQLRLLLPLAATAAAAVLSSACSDSASDPLHRMTPASAAYAEGGNADAAHTCQHGGFADLYRLDGTGFTNTGDCAAYAAQGGTLAKAVQFSGIRLGGCNANTFGYEVDGVEHDVLSKSAVCSNTASTTPDFTIYVPLGETPRVYLRDNTCGWTFYADDGLHGLVTGTNPFVFKINDGGGRCELNPTVNTWDPTSPDPRLRDLSREATLDLVQTSL